MNPPTLVLITTSFPITADGSEAAGSFIADLVEELAIHVHIRVVAPGPISKHERWSEHVDIYRYAAPNKPLSTLKIWSPKDIHWIVRVMRGGLKAAHIAAAEGPSHILAMWGLPCGEWARRIAQKHNISYSCWLLGSDVWSLGRIPIARSMLSRVIRQSACTYADGYKLATDAQAISSVPVQFLPSTRAIDAKRSQPPRDTPPYRLLFLGRWHKNKGVDILLEALALLNDADWKLIDLVEIQGGGPMETLVHERIEALARRGRPILAGGFLNKEQASHVLSLCDIVLIPSRIESIPVIFSDAMKMGRPVIATPTGDLPRLVTKGCGLICDEISSTSFLKSLRSALHSGHNFSAAAIQLRADEFSIKSVAQQIIINSMEKPPYD